MYILKTKNGEYILSDVECSFLREQDGGDVIGKASVVDIEKKKCYTVEYTVAEKVLKYWFVDGKYDGSEKWETDVENFISEEIFLKLITGDLLSGLTSDAVQKKLRIDDIILGGNDFHLTLERYLRLQEVRREYLEENKGFVFRLVD